MSRRPPVLSGTLQGGGAIELLRELEDKRITGELRFESEDDSGTIVFYGGAIAVEQELRGDGRDPVDVLLELREGTYEIHPRLPVLAVSKGDDYVKTGSLAVHVPADLMSYCERGGLTGRLVLAHEGRRAEAIYDAGELLAIELDGRGDADLSEVFAWDQGRFRIELDPSAPERLRAAAEDEAPTTEHVPVPKRRRDDTRQFLRVVEMALVDVIGQSERARSPTRTGPPMPPPPKARPRPPAVPPPARRTDEHTVRLIYLSGDPPSDHADTSTRHVAKGSAPEVALADARPERRRGSTHAAEADEMAIDMDESEDAPATEAAAPSAIEVDPEPIEVDVLASDEIASSEPIAPAPEPDGLEPPSDGAAIAQDPGHPLVGLAWAVAVLLLGVAILAMLARLPPLQ